MVFLSLGDGEWLFIVMTLGFVFELQFFDDCQKVDHSSVPRKLRSGL